MSPSTNLDPGSGEPRGESYALPSDADEHVVALTGRVDDGALADLRDRIARRLDHGRVIVDLTAVTEFRTAPLSRFCRALREASRGGIAIAVAGGPPHVHRTVSLCAMDGVEHYRTVAHARATADSDPAEADGS